MASTTMQSLRKEAERQLRAYRQNGSTLRDVEKNGLRTRVYRTSGRVVPPPSARELADMRDWTRIIDRILQLGVRYDRTVVRIDRWYPSSQICSQCGRRDGRKPLNIREWECPQCGTRLDRDWNAALNILDAAGLAESLNARGGDVRRRLAQTGRNADAREAGTRRTVSLH